MSIAVQVALVMVVLLVYYWQQVCRSVWNRTLFRSFNDPYAAIQCSFCNICTEIFAGSNSFSLIAIPFFILRKHYE